MQTSIVENNKIDERYLGNLQCLNFCILGYFWSNSFIFFTFKHCLLYLKRCISYFVKNFVQLCHQFNPNNFWTKGQGSLERSRNSYLSSVGILQYVIKCFISFVCVCKENTFSCLLHYNYKAWLENCLYNLKTARYITWRYGRN